MSSKNVGGTSTASTPFSKTNSEEQDKLLLEPMLYLMQVPSKNIRAKLLHSFNLWTKVSDEKVDAIAEIVQMLHNASLLLDDIEDNSTLRRGIPAAHKIYGASTINSANYAMFIALERVLDLGHAAAGQVFCEQMLECHRGQGMDLYWRDNYVCPSLAEYKQMVIRKTGGLFNLAIRLMQLFSEDEQDYQELISLMGLYFQVRDDYGNLCLKEYATNKSFAEDITEGKFSFPVVHYVLAHPEDKKLINILRQRTHDIELKKYAVALLKESLEATIEYMEELDGQVRAEIVKLGGNSHLIALMDELKNWKK